MRTILSGELLRDNERGRSWQIGLQHKGSPVKVFYSIYDLFAGKLPGSWIFSFEGPPSAGLLLL